MTPKEKLKEIETFYGMIGDVNPNTEWLIARVKRLEEALSDIAENDAHYEAPFRIARKALEGK